MSQARTTVVIATRNRAAELARSLRQLRALRPTPPIVVVDNGSHDDTAALVRRDFAEVRLVSLAGNAGVAARNIGVRRAETPYVAFSDDDSWWEQGALPRAETLFDAYPRVGLLAATTLVGPQAEPDPVCELMADSPLGTAPDVPGPLVLGFLACSAIVRKQAFLEVGGFSELLHFGAEETLLAYDLAAAGWALSYVEQLRAHHHPSTTRPGERWRRRLELRNNALIALMRRPVPGLLRSLGPLLNEPAAAAGTLRRLPHALGRRRRLPRHVEAQIRELT
ncbi:putative glycosyltransferase [Saccharomonospora marina XMU15]|uniref:Putative glycosyltransferase n=1 Tax=Saccharomonospora marina XMU15 TaxID=882083 RepID=H5X2F1_9PSEU|nr:glycosyltransferase [Saccharomonospora marina]EHR49816.1 putative glycosyltransferase [Saccharomonospora marina XMU15]